MNHTGFSWWLPWMRKCWAAIRFHREETHKYKDMHVTDKLSGHIKVICCTFTNHSREIVVDTIDYLIKIEQLSKWLVPLYRLLWTQYSWHWHETTHVTLIIPHDCPLLSLVFLRTCYCSEFVSHDCSHCHFPCSLPSQKRTSGWWIPWSAGHL